MRRGNLNPGHSRTGRTRVEGRVVLFRARFFRIVTGISRAFFRIVTGISHAPLGLRRGIYLRTRQFAIWRYRVYFIFPSPFVRKTSRILNARDCCTANKVRVAYVETASYIIIIFFFF